MNYFDISKDILYCNTLLSKERKSVITVLYHLYDNLTTWFAPVLCHTMEEAWKEFKTENIQSIHLKISKKIPVLWRQDELINKWKLIRKVRRQVNTAIEQVRNKKLIGSSLEAEIFIYVGDNHLKRILNSVEMKKVMMVSQFIFLDSPSDKVKNSLYQFNIKEENINILIKKTNFLKCVRCWQFEEDVKKDGELCSRCKQALK